MENLTPAIAKLREEFATHTSKKSGLRFQPSLQASTGISMLTRDLETKRQLGSLTANEKSLLAEIETLWQDISWFNTQGVAKSQGETEKIYSLKDSKFIDAPKPQPKPEIHPISEQQAEEIISGLNKQFEEKVMSKIHHDEPAAESGQNLQEYLSRMQDQKSRFPFAGEESHIDLEKLKASS